ncbi:protein HEG homolog 1-like, partial [Nematolebias whitei]|uniref:protein HEG homolog 1-like n=1 Tax=Nematolebias whitei TaxID=451745 RepID=UPI00189BC7E6
MDYDEKMADKTTKEFQETSKIITDEINEIFIDKNSLGSTVVALRKFQSSKVSSKSSDKVEASVEIIFQANAGVKEATVKETFEKAKETPGSLFQGSTFIAKNLCDSDPCEKITTHCTSEDGSFTCSCSKGYFPTGYSDRMCVACPSGEREEDSKCVP